MGREKSDHCMVPKKGRNGPGGKAVTASEQTSQLNLVFETAESPEGAVGGADVDRSASGPYAVPKPKTTARQGPSAMDNGLEAILVAIGIAAGGNAGVGIRMYGGPYVPRSRMCSHKYGSVGRVPGQSGALTRLSEDRPNMT